MEHPWHSYGMSLAIWDQMVLPATRHKWTHPAFNPSQTGWYLTYLPRRDGRLSLPRRFTRPQMVTHLWLNRATAVQRVPDGTALLICVYLFAVTDCRPMIGDLDVLLGHLHKTLDWHQFIVSVRHQFTQLVWLLIGRLMLARLHRDWLPRTLPTLMYNMIGRLWTLPTLLYDMIGRLMLSAALLIGCEHCPLWPLLCTNWIICQPHCTYSSHN